MSFVPYNSYKPSSVEWLGDVPTHWEVRQVKQVSKILRGKFTHRPRNDPSLYNGPYPFIQTGDVARAKKTITEYSQTLNKQGLAVSLMFPTGTLVMTIAANIGDVAILDFEACFPDSVVGFVPRQNVDRDYLYYLFRAMKAEFLRETPVNTQGNLNVERIGSRHIALPPISEQISIVHYLDQADERIRRYISSRERLIELLEEYRQAVIQHAVTRGLDPDVRLKPSGVEWLGDVLAHWEVSAVKRHYSIQLGKMLQNGPNVPTDIAVPYLKAQHVQWFSVRTTDAPTMWATPHEIEQFGIRAGDLLVCEGGEGGRCCLVEEVPPGYIIQNALHRVRPSGNCRNDYLQYVMSSISKTGWFDAINNKATIAHFTVEKFDSLMIPVPPFPEQTAIVAYLDKATADIDAAIDRARREIELLGEYRTRLIADVVTGKVDVREATAELSESLSNGQK